MTAKPVLALVATVAGELAVTVLSVRSPQPATSAVSNHVIIQMRDLKILCGLFMAISPEKDISKFNAAGHLPNSYGYQYDF
jgi:hypothetical protein